MLLVLGHYWILEELEAQPGARPVIKTP